MNEDWISLAQVISAGASLLMLAIWAFYTKLFYDTYREQHRPWFLLHQSGGVGLQSQCLLVNMSQRTVHVETVLAVVHTAESSLVARLISYPGPVEDEDGNNRAQPFREGPIREGDVMSLGTFEGLFGSLMADLADGQVSDEASLYETIEALELRVITASIVDEQRPLGARRFFTIQPLADRAARIDPVDFRTKQMRSRKERDEVLAWLEALGRGDGRSERLSSGREIEE